MTKPVLVIMAAGMGSRYGGLKQMEAVGSNGELIIDFSLYDAMRAGFQTVIFIIKKENELDFRNLIDHKAGRFMETKYAFQELSDLPDGYSVPEGRQKPWGTCHAVLAARDLIEGPFAVINADDYYGAGAFRQAYDFLISARDGEKLDCCMIGYRLSHTLTDSGHVARGVCEASADGFLEKIVERTKVIRRDGKVFFTEDEEKTWVEIQQDAVVSMNFWGFSAGIIKEFKDMLPPFLDKLAGGDPLKGEMLLPHAVGRLLNVGKARFKILKSEDKWHGVTYREDREDVVSALQSLKDKGIYPEALWK